MDNSNQSKTEFNKNILKPSAAFIGASWCSLLIGTGAYLIGLWNATMQLNEKGYYFVVLLYGLFSAISLQKTVRDKLEGIPVTNIYFGASCISLSVSIVLLAVGLRNATLELSEKGFYAMSFVLCLFAAISVQKNVRDLAQFPTEEKPMTREDKDSQF